MATTTRTPAVLDDPLHNKGTAFTRAERKDLGLVGRLPSGELTLDQQAQRAYDQLQRQDSNLAKNVYLEQLHDRNEVLYYALLTSHLAELLPIVYDPTVGEAIERYSQEYRRPRGLFLSIDEPNEMEAAFASLGFAPDDVDSDGAHVERRRRDISAPRDNLTAADPHGRSSQAIDESMAVSEGQQLYRTVEGPVIPARQHRALEVPFAVGEPEFVGLLTGPQVDHRVSGTCGVLEQGGKVDDAR
jgi:hypothetical protein